MRSRTPAIEFVKKDGKVFLGIPCPLSVTRMATWSVSTFAESVMSPPSGVYLIEFSIKLQITRLRCLGSEQIGGIFARRFNLQFVPSPCGGRHFRFDARRKDVGRLDSFHGETKATALDTRQIEQIKY